MADLLHMVACKAAVKAGDKLSPDEIQALLDRRHLVADSHHCPHGRPTALVFTKAELEKQFGRNLSDKRGRAAQAGSIQVTAGVG